MPSEFTLDDFEEAPASEFSLSDFEEEPALRPEIGELRQAVTPPDLGAVPFSMGGVNAPPSFKASTQPTTEAAVDPVTEELKQLFEQNRRRRVAEGKERPRTFGEWATTPAIRLPRFTINKDDPIWVSAVKEIDNLLISLPEFATAPAGIAAAPASMIPGGSVAVRAAFAGDIAKSMFEQAPALYENWSKLSPAEKTKGIVDFVGSGALFGTLAKYKPRAGMELPPEGVLPPAEIPFGLLQSGRTGRGFRTERGVVTSTTGEVVPWPDVPEPVVGPVVRPPAGVTVPPPRPSVAPAVAAGAVAKASTPADIAKQLGLASGKEVPGDLWQFDVLDPKDNQPITFSVPKGSDAATVDAAAKAKLAEFAGTPPLGETKRLTTATPTDLEPALLVNGKPVSGGFNHEAIFKANFKPDSPDAADWFMAQADDANHVFVDKSGNYYTRREAADLLKEKEPLTSERLRDMQKATPEPKSPEPSPAAPKDKIGPRGPTKVDDQGVRVANAGSIPDVDAGIAGLLEDMNAAGYKTAQSMSGLKEDYPSGDRYSPDGYIAFWEKDLTRDQIDNIRKAAKKAGLYFDDQGLLFFAPSVDVRVGMLKSGIHPFDLKDKADELAIKKLISEGIITEKDLKESSGQVTTRRITKYPSGDKFFEYLELRDKIWEELKEKEGGIISDSEIKAKWEAFYDELLGERVSGVPPKATTKPVLVRKDAALTPTPPTPPTPTAKPTPAPAAEKKAATVVKKVAATEGQRPAKEVKSELVSRIEDEIDKAIDESKIVLEQDPENPNQFTARGPSIARYSEVNKTKGGKFEVSSGKVGFGAKGTVKATFDTMEEAKWFMKGLVAQVEGSAVVQIPGDGTFTIIRNGENLIDFWKRAKRIDTKPTPIETIPTGERGKVDADEIVKTALKMYGEPRKAIAGIERQLASEQEFEPGQRDLLDRAVGFLRDQLPEVKIENEINRLQELISDHERDLKTARERIAKTRSEMKSKQGTAKQRNFIYEQENLIRNLEVQLPKRREALDLLLKQRQPTPPPGTQGLAKTVRQKWTGATDPTLGSEAGFVSLAPIQALIDRTSPYVKAVVDTIMAVGKHQFDIGKATDFRRSVFHWSAKLQRSFGEAASAQKEIRTKVPDKTRREGITNWIQAGGDPTILASRRADTEAWRDPKTGKPHPQQKQLLAGYDAALHLTPEEIAVAQDVKRTYDELGNRGQTYDVLKTFKDNYVTQIWNLRRGPIPKGAGVGRSLMLKDRFRFAKASKFDTFFDGEQAGYVPRTKDISDILPLYMHEMNSVIAARQLVEQMAGGVGSDGRKLLAPRGIGVAVDDVRGKATLVMPDVPAEKTRDYVIIENQPALHEWRWVTKDAAGNPVFNKSDLMVHPEVADHFRNVLGRSAIKEWYRSRTTASAEIPKFIARALDFAQSETKRTMLGVLTPFHQVQEGTHAVGHRVNPFFNNPKIDLVNDAGQMDAAKHGLMLLPDRTSSQQFMEGFKQSALVTKIPVLGPLADHYSEYLFHQYIPGIKYKTYQAILQRNTHLYGKELTAGRATLEDIKILSAEQANAAYGHLNYADLGRNPTILHIMRLGLLAPDFLEARARFAGQAIKGVGGAKIGREQLVALATLALAQASLSYIMANITGGTWDEKDPFAFHVGNKKFTMRSVPEDAYRFAKDTRSFVYARLNPIIGRGAVQYASGVDWRGQKVTKARTTKELLTQPVPLFLRPLVGLGNTPLMAWEEIAAASGLKISRYSAVSEMYKVAHQWKADNPDPKVQRAEARYEASSFPDSDYKPLRESLIKNDMKGAMTAYEELLKTGHPHKDIDNVMKPWTGGTVNKATGELTPRHPKAFTSAKLESRFVQSLTDEQRATYNRAIIERRELYARFQQMLSQQQPKPKLASEFSLKDFE